MTGRGQNLQPRGADSKKTWGELFIFCYQHDECLQLFPSPVSCHELLAGSCGMADVWWKIGKSRHCPFLKQHRSTVCQGWMLGMLCLGGECPAQPSRVTLNPLFSDFMSGTASGRAHLGIWGVSGQHFPALWVGWGGWAQRDQSGFCSLQHRL